MHANRDPGQRAVISGASEMTGQEDGIRYRSLHGYKYEVAETYTITIPELWKLDYPHRLTFFALLPTGAMIILPGYAWDGASGPAIDTPNFMRGSLVHDVFYQAMRMGILDTKAWRLVADNVLRRICIEDGMSRVRAWGAYRFVRLFGARYAQPTGHLDASDMILTAPCLPPDDPPV